MAETQPRRFEVVTDAPADEAKRDLAASALLLGLQALSQRALAATMDLFMLVTVGLVFWLWYPIRSDPSPSQIVSLALFAVFVLAANYIVRKIR